MRLLAFRTKAFMEYYRTAGFALLEWQREKVLLWNAVNNQVLEISKAEPFIVTRVAHGARNLLHPMPLAKKDLYEPGIFQYPAFAIPVRQR